MIILVVVIVVYECCLPFADSLQKGDLKPAPPS